MSFLTALLAISSMVLPISPEIEISSDPALLDQETPIIVHHLVPGETIAVHAEAMDDNGTHWASFASFQADCRRNVDLSTQSPVNGTYSGTDPMGLFWSMEGHSSATFTVREEQIPIDLRVFRGNEEIAFRKIIRWKKSPDVKRVFLRDNGLVGVLFLPR